MKRFGYRWRALALGALLVGLAVVRPAGVHAATDTVSTCDESTLRSVISSAAANDMVNFGCSGTITLTSGGGGAITLSKNLTIDGNGQTVTISGGGAVQVFTVPGGVTATLNGLTVEDGFISNGNGNGNGGGIYNTGTLAVTNSTLSGNNARIGAGIANYGTLRVTNSTLSGNSANAFGGGILNDGTLSVTNSTFSGNVCTGCGGSAIGNGGTLNVTNSTFSGNSGGVAIINGNNTATVGASILANNTAGNCAGAITDNGYNLESGTDCGFTGTGSLRNTDPKLSALANNGGPTQTMALSVGSPAIDVIPSASCPSTDQRGSPRPDNSQTSCDIGAYESGATVPVPSCDQAGLLAALSTVDPGRTVQFTADCTITLASTITLSKDVTINGNGHVVTISGGSTSPSTGVQVFSVNSGANVTLQDLTISGGQSASSGGGIANAGTLIINSSNLSGNTSNACGVIVNISCTTAPAGGGGIYNGGNLTINNSIVSGNHVSGASHYGNNDPEFDVNGGGVYNAGTMSVGSSTFNANNTENGSGGGIYNGGTLSISDSTFSTNTSTNSFAGGGGIWNASGSMLTVSNSTFSGNNAPPPGAGIANKGTLTISNSTFSGNSSSYGAIFNSGTVDMANTILAGPGKDCFAANSGFAASGVTDGGGNLADDATCGFTQSGSKNSVTTINLGTLANNGGPVAGAPGSAATVQTIALLSGSAAIFAGRESVCTAAPINSLDQRGDSRNTTTCDSGAYDTGIP